MESGAAEGREEGRGQASSQWSRSGFRAGRERQLCPRQGSPALLSAALRLTRRPHAGPRPGPLHLPAVAVHTPAVSRAAVALDGRIVSLIVTLGDEEPRRPGPLGVHRPKDVLPLTLASGFLHFCPRERQKEGRQFKVIAPFCFINF